MPKVCSIDGCDNTNIMARGWCVKHYRRWQRRGSTQRDEPRSQEDRFWAKVDRSGDCWVWQGSRRSMGRHGHFIASVGGVRKSWQAHRFAYYLVTGDLVEGLVLDHICYESLCVNPAHLRPCTKKQNGENRAGLSSNNKSGVRGVFWDTTTSRWRGQVGHNGQRVRVGLFKTLEEAERAVVKKRLQLHTHNDLDRI